MWIDGAEGGHIELHKGKEEVFMEVENREGGKGEVILRYHQAIILWMSLGDFIHTRRRELEEFKRKGKKK